MAIHGYKGGVISATPPTTSVSGASGVWTVDDALQAGANWPVAPALSTNSLRFRSSASAYLSRTAGTPTSQKTWTYSAWIKRGKLGAGADYYSLLGGHGGSYVPANYDFIRFQPDDTLVFALAAGSNTSLNTTQVFRDCSSWYHILVQYDSTQATASNRAKIYVNGSQVTAFNTATYPAQNTNSTGINASGLTQYFGALSTGSPSLYFDGYIADTYFIDGQALTPNYFGAIDGATGVWQPATYRGTYGTNGFYLPFTDNSALTSGSNAGLGKDFSGNGNYWNTNNISITSGATYDSMTDVPTLTSATAANYCVWNALVVDKSTLSSGNLDVSGTDEKCDVGTFGVSTGKWYWEITVGSGTYNPYYGVTSAANDSDRGGSYAEAGRSYVGGDSGNNKNYTATSLTADSDFSTANTAGATIGFALDCDAGEIKYYVNNVLKHTDSTLPVGTILYPLHLNTNTGANAWKSLSANFGQRPFAYTPPTGYVALNTYNLPTPTIGATSSSQANKYMDALLYTGNGSASQRTDISWANMQPDMVWIKSRSNAYNNDINDDIRGVTQALCTNSTAVEDGPVAFGSDGFGYNGVANQLRVYTSDQRWNANSATYVAWGWKASGAAAVTNTAGSITSTVSANTTSGFSVVTYTGNGSNATVGHGLGVAPKLLIIKRRDSTSNWPVWHTSLPSAQRLVFLELNFGADSDYPTFLNNTVPTSSVFSVGTSSNTNANGGTYVAYCFSEVSGYSKISSYTANGSAEGPFIYCGFRPKFILWKNIGPDANGWIIEDAARSPYNAAYQTLQPNDSGAEGSNTVNSVDFLSNGFKIRGTSANINQSPYTIAFMAFAESPFKYANAR